MSKTSKSLVCAALAGLLGSGCVAGDDQDLELSTTVEEPTYSFDEFQQALQTIEVDGAPVFLYRDIQFRSLEEAEDYYWGIWDRGSALTLAGGGALDTNRIERDIRYCVSNSFGSNKAAIRRSMQRAAADWASAARLRFTYDSSRDGNCTSAGSIDIAVRPTSGSFIASAFFPRRGNAEGNLLVVVNQFFQQGLSQDGVMRHELGHILGFRHEHTRIRSNPCYEDGNWIAITQYDSSSTMHYPQCNGTGSFSSLALTGLDRAGAAAVYGSP